MAANQGVPYTCLPCTDQCCGHAGIQVVCFALSRSIRDEERVTNTIIRSISPYHHEIFGAMQMSEGTFLRTNASCHPRYHRTCPSPRRTAEHCLPLHNTPRAATPAGQFVQQLLCSNFLWCLVLLAQGHYCCDLIITKPPRRQSCVQ